MSKNNELETTSIPKLLFKFSLPAIIGLLVNALYNIIDGIFVGRGVGKEALAAVTLTLPIITIFMACIMLIGMGATSLISLKLGERKEKEAEQIVANAFVLFIILGLLLTVIGLLFLEPLLIFSGASKEVLPFAKDYLRIVLIGSIFLALGVGMNSFIRAEGNPKMAMMTMLAGTLTNIVFNYVFIFPLNMGIEGAALATILGYCVSSTWVLLYFFTGKSKVKVKKESFKLQLGIIKSIVIIGFPTFILQMGGSVQQLALNKSLAKYGGDLHLAVIGIIMSVITLLTMPALGINQGAQPIIGYNYGAKKYDRVKDVLKLSLLSATVLIGLSFIGSKIWPEQLISLFNDDPELIALGVKAMRIFFFFIPLIGVHIVSSGYFQAIGKPVQATILGLSRQVFIFLPAILILPVFWGIDGVWWAAPIADVGAFIVTGIWLLFEIRNLNEIHIEHLDFLEQKKLVKVLES